MTPSPSPPVHGHCAIASRPRACTQTSTCVQKKRPCHFGEVIGAQNLLTALAGIGINGFSAGGLSLGWETCEVLPSGGVRGNSGPLWQGKSIIAGLPELIIHSSFCDDLCGSLVDNIV